MIADDNDNISSSQGDDSTSDDARRRDEEAFLESYKDDAYARPAVSVDLTIFTLTDGALQVLLIQRRGHPFRGRWALPGGFLRVANTRENQGEELDEAAARELAEETGLAQGSVFLEQLYTFGGVFRDPRMRVITVAYYALIPPELAATIRAGSDARVAAWHPAAEAIRLDLAFDHDKILAVALERLRGKLDYSEIAFELVPRVFTTAELRAVHEIVEGRPLDPGNFRRRVNRLIARGLLVATGAQRATGRRPAQLYRYARRKTAEPLS